MNPSVSVLDVLDVGTTLRLLEMRNVLVGPLVVLVRCVSSRGLCLMGTLSAPVRLLMSEVVLEGRLLGVTFMVRLWLWFI